MWDGLAQLSENHVAVALFLLGLPIAALFGWSTIRAKTEARHRERLLDTRTWETIIAGLQPNWADRYFGAISVSTGWFDRIYGPRLLGWRAFDRALSFAFAYAVLTLFVGWVVFDAGNLGGVAFITEGLTIWQRLSALAAVLFTAGTLFAISRHETAIIKALLSRFKEWPTLMDWIKRFMRLSQPNIARILHSILSLASVSALFVLPFTISGDAIISVVCGASIAVTVAALYTRDRSGQALGEVLGIVSAARAVGVLVFTALGFAIIGGIDPFFSTLVAEFILLLLVLPFLNAIADFLSVAATRHFLRQISAKGLGAWGVLGGLALDILFAILCLALLLILMTQTLDLWANATPIPLPFDWRAYRDTLCGGDWRRGTMLWLMLITTLAPTALHLAVGFGAVFSHSAQVDRQIAAILTPARDALQTTHARTKEKGDGARARLVLHPDAVHSLEDLLARKEASAKLVTVTLFALFMAALMYGVFHLAQNYALPYLCPAP